VVDPVSSFPMLNANLPHSFRWKKTASALLAVAVPALLILATQGAAADTSARAPAKGEIRTTEEANGSDDGGVNRVDDVRAHRFGQPGTMQAGWDLFGFAKEYESVSFDKAPQRPPFPFLPGEDAEQSVSVGTVTDGYLVNAAAVPSHESLEILPRQRARELRYGTQEMMDLLVETAERVAIQHEGTVVQLGNVGRQYGGDIPYSVSHNSGRDADLAFLATDPKGRPALLPDLLRFDEHGRSVAFNGYYRFDVERNWSLVRSLVLSSKAQLQYIFISDPLREMLLDHARESGENPGIVQRAATLLRQPGPSIPHNDHLHLRIYCSQFDVGGGCDQTGAIHRGIELHRQRRSEAVDLAMQALDHEDSSVRAAGLRRLKLLEAVNEANDDVLSMLGDPSPDVRRAAIDLAVDWRMRGFFAQLDDFWSAESDDGVREHLLGALRRADNRYVADFLVSLLGEPITADGLPKPYDLRIAAVDALKESRSLKAVESLIDLLEDSSPELRARAARALRMISNADNGETAWRQAGLSDDTIDEAQQGWRAWLERTRRQFPTPEQWVKQGFVEAGYQMGPSARVRARELARASGDTRDFIRVNAQQWLMGWSNNYPRSLEWPRSDARLYWTRWVDRHPYRFR
jgi:penicillin-insensitive murein endopeptidase